MRRRWIYFFLAEKKKRARNSNRINRTSETTLRDKERGERGKNLKEGEEIRTWSIVWKGWLRSREARQGAFSLAATKRRRFLPAIISFPFLSFLPPPPSFSYSTFLPSLRGNPSRRSLNHTLFVSYAAQE